jgi:hypothetical protein
MGAKMTETADVTPGAALPEEPLERGGRQWEYRGSDFRTYPHRLDLETGAPLYVEPGDVFYFGELMPPGDGLWYDSSSGEQYTDSPASAGAGETEE